MPAPDSTRRFTGRVADYERGRPGYPEPLFDRLAAVAGLGPGAAIADLGSGTGISSAALLARGYRVWAVEPNEAMRLAAESRFSGEPRFVSIAASAESTGLEPGSIDLVFAAQAFHWFDVARVRREALRITRPGAHAALVWNSRRAGGDRFHVEYERLLQRFGTDYGQVGHRGVPPERLEEFYGGGHETFVIPHAQPLDRGGLRARLLSSSYLPAADAPGYEEMLAELDRIFDRHARDGSIEMRYDAELHLGRLVRREVSAS